MVIYKISRRKSLLVSIPIIAVIELMLFGNIIYSENLVVKNLINPDVEKITKFFVFVFLGLSTIFNTSNNICSRELNICVSAIILFISNIMLILTKFFKNVF